MIRYNTKRYWGKSTDEKPINAQVGDRFLEIDTSTEYVLTSYNRWISIGKQPFLKNQTENYSVNRIEQYQSIFNPSDLLITNSSIFIIDNNADYYVLGDLINNGVLEVNGTLKIGGSLISTGTIIGSGVIE